MKNIWQLQEAQDRLSEVVDKAIDAGPQTLTRHAREVAVILSKSDFDRLCRGKDSFVEFLRNSPLFGLTIEREDDSPREVEAPSVCRQNRQSEDDDLDAQK